MSRKSAITAFYAGLFSIACVVLLQFVPDLHHTGPSATAFLLITGAFVAAELLPISFSFGGNRFAFTPNEVPLVLGVFLIPAMPLLAARFVGSLVALAVRQGSRPSKLVFNLWFLELQAIVFVLVFRWAPQPLELGWQSWPFVFTALVGKEVLTQLVMIDVLTRLGTFIRASAVLKSGLMQVGTTTLLTALSMVGLRLYESAPADLVLFAGVVVGCVLTYRSQLRAQAKFALTSQLYDFARLVAQTPPRTDQVPKIATKVREVLSGNRVDVVLLPDGMGQPLVRYFGDADNIERADLVDASELGPPWDVALAATHSMLLPPSGDFPGAVFAPLSTDGAIAGIFGVFGHAGERVAFDSNDQQMLETMASHLSSWLENGRLIEQLRNEVAVREHQALHDTLTDLPNRRLFQERSAAAIVDAKRQGHAGAVFLFDLDDFKEINDALGHRAGDIVLGHVAEQVSLMLPETATLARLGGDEFSVLLPFVRNAEDARAMGERVVAAVNTPLQLEELRLSIGASLGVTMFPRDAEDASTLLQRADVAMYTAKTKRTGVEFYNLEDDRSSARKLQLASDLREAIDAGDIVLYLQPKVDLATNEVIGAEALARWNHKTWGLIPPDDFIPIAEQTGAIALLTLSVLEQGIALAKELHADNPVFSVSINLSMRNLLDEDLPHQVERILRTHDVDPALVTLEITESCIMTDPARVMRVLAHLDEIGVKMSIDDFGTGQSSFAYLRELPVDEVKIDKVFVKRMLTSPQDEAIVRSVIDLGRNLDLQVVAEGVETDEMFARLHELGCNVGQGFGIGRPMPAAVFPEWMAERSKTLAAVR